MVPIRDALPGVVVREEAPSLVRKRDGFPVDWDPAPWTPEEGSATLRRASLDLLLVVKARSCPGVNEDEPGACGGLAPSGTEENFVSPISAAELPRSLEQLEELANDLPVR
jgi:hypothetical protein